MPQAVSRRKDPSVWKSLFRWVPSRDRKGQPLGLLPGHGDFDTGLDKWHCVISGCLWRVVRWKLMEQRPRQNEGPAWGAAEGQGPLLFPGS